MKSTRIILTIVVAIVVIIGIIYFVTKPSGTAVPPVDTTTPVTDTTPVPDSTVPPVDTTTPVPPATTTTTTTPSTTTTTTTVTPNLSEKTYTMADVSTHGTSSDCWTVVNDIVYNVTSWINQHPGGPQAIRNLCGTDGTAGFEGQHAGQKRPANELESFRIGTIAK